MPNNPVMYQEISDFLVRNPNIDPFQLRKNTITEIEKVIGMPLICYATNLNVSRSSIE